MMIVLKIIALQYRTGSKPETGAIVIGAFIVGLILYFINKSRAKNSSDNSLVIEKLDSNLKLNNNKTSESKKMNRIPLIVNKILELDSYVINELESKVQPLTPAGKYQAFLLTSSIIINRLKSINAFSVYKVNGEELFTEILNQAEVKFSGYKHLFWDVANTFKHRSGILEGNINRENRNTFKLGVEELKRKSLQTINLYDLEIDKAIGFEKIYINLYVFSFFDTNITEDEQIRLRSSYLELVSRYNTIEIQNFNSIMMKLINSIATKIDEDRTFRSIIQSL